MTYKIKNTVTGLFSHGTISEYSWDGKKQLRIHWSTKGKEWSNEKNVAAHLLKYLSKGGDVSKWEIIEVKYHPTKPVNEWITDKMLVAVLKAKH